MTEQTTTEVTEEQIADMIEKMVGTTPQPEEKTNVHTFLTKVVQEEDTTKLGYLTQEELGMPQIPVRSDKSLALWSEMIMDNPFYRDFFLKESEYVTSSSLSKDGFLIKHATIIKKEIADTTKKQSSNKGWFKKKDKEVTET
jgi:hypothetical protein